MELNEPFRRVVLVILDGLRVDAIDAFALPTLSRLRSTAAYCVAHTVELSVGGGVDPKDHMSDHPFDRLVPLFFTGSGVTRGVLGAHVSLLDVPATVLWALGLERPSSYVGTPLVQIVRGSPRTMPAASVA